MIIEVLTHVFIKSIFKAPEEALPPPPPPPTGLRSFGYGHKAVRIRVNSFSYSLILILGGQKNICSINTVDYPWFFFIFGHQYASSYSPVV
jgi:hypothetical protein